MKTFNQKQSGFTLVELIVVIAIIAVLSSVAFMSMSSETASARDASRTQDLFIFENAIATSNSKNRPISFGTDITIDTTSGTLATLRGAKVVSIDENVFEPTILQKIGQDPSGNKYIGVFLNQNMYQLFAILENPSTGTTTALVAGTFKEGVLLDNLVADIEQAGTALSVNDASKFLIGDTLNIEGEDLTVTDVTPLTNVLTVTRAANATTAVKHLKGTPLKLKTFAKGGDANTNNLVDSSGQSLLCIGALVKIDGATAADNVKDSYCDESKVILDGLQALPFKK
jgi:prepilin-type N-terminal cleavage/methylation domain-containing protein